MLCAFAATCFSIIITAHVPPAFIAHAFSSDVVALACTASSVTVAVARAISSIARADSFSSSITAATACSAAKPESAAAFEVHVRLVQEADETDVGGALLDVG